MKKVNFSNTIPYENKPRLVTLVATSAGYKRLPAPSLSDSLSCEFCGTTKNFTWLTESKEWAWFCGLICLDSKLPLDASGCQGTTQAPRAILWPKLCELNGIGNANHDVSFEKVEQTPGKINFLIEFCQKPKGIILMHGPSGTGKTYATLGTMELFSRKSSSVLFFTHNSLMNKWLDVRKQESYSDLLDRIERVALLVIDDFGTCEPSAGFLAYLMNLINARLQYTDRGTIITTNLSPEILSDFCGEALTDRIRTGQEFIFTGESRRKKIPL